MAVPARTKQLLYGLGGLLAIVAWQQWAPGSTAAPGDEPAPAVATRTGRAASRRPIPDRIVTLRLADLDAVPAGFEIGRDPFRFGKLPEPEPVKPVERKPTPCEINPCGPGCPPHPSCVIVDICHGPRPECKPICPSADPRCPTPPLPYNVVGLFGSPTRRIAVLAKGKEIINALEGDVLEGKFIVEKIGLESVDFKFVGFPNAPVKRLALGAKGS